MLKTNESVSTNPRPESAHPVRRPNPREAGAIVTAFQSSASRASKPATIVRDAIRLRPSQSAVFGCLQKENLTILNAPTGWGKSLVLVALAADDLLRDAHRKLIVIIPQCLISKGFVGAANLALPDGTEVQWRVRHNLCQRVQGKVDQLRRFILSPADGDLVDRVVVTTNMGFACAFNSLEPEEAIAAFHHTTLVLDEAHHVQASDEGFNQLGAAVNLLLNVNDPTIRMILSTAFFFRGDRLPIIPENHMERFVRHHIPFDEHWSQLRHLESYRYDFVAFKGTVWNELEALLQQSQEPTIFFCPFEGHRLHLGKTKKQFVHRLKRLVGKHYQFTMTWHPEHRHKAKKVILDLVDPRHRTEKVRFAMQHGDEIAAIITVGMFKEGADWVQASRVIDLVPTGSDQDRNQRFGRLIRDCPGKKHVSYFSFFPHITDDEPDKQREQLTRLFAHFHASLVLENALNPIRVPVEKVKLDGESGTQARNVNLLGEFDLQEQEAIIRDCCEQLVVLASEKASIGQSVSPEEARQTILAVLRDQHGITKNEGGLAKQIALILRRRQNVHLPCEELVKAGFDKVWHEKALEAVVLFSGGVGGPATFREIRQTIDTVFERQWMEMHAKVRLLPCAPDTQSSAYWWCTHNKVLYRQGTLSADRIRLLESLPWWSWAETFDNRWVRQFDRVRQLPACPKSGTPEYDWLRTQRRLFDAGRLPHDRITACESIPWWSWGLSQGNWDEMYQRVRLLPSPPRTKTQEYDWVKHQRRMYARRKLPEDRIRLLEQIGWWSWRTVTAEGWEARWRAIKALAKPPASTTSEYHWVIKQKKRKAAGTLEPERIARCQQIAWWSWE